MTGIKLRNSQQIYFVDKNGLFAKKGTQCIAETEHGTDLGTIMPCGCAKKIASEDIKGKLLRKATQADLDTIPEIESIESKAFEVCRTKAKEKNLEMKLIGVKCLFDHTKIIFYFVAESRIDFRELVRDLAAVFRTRIEMRQIGVRDESRVIGGYGTCGRRLCCEHLKGEFEPVSIKMAKEQNLNLNSLKISGMCGRLLCCLCYEYDVYRELNETLPHQGSEITSGASVFNVEAVDTLKQTMRIRCQNHVMEVHRKSLDFDGKKYSISKETMDKLMRVDDDAEIEEK